jgi:hypothetical protein
MFYNISPHKEPQNNFNFDVTKCDATKCYLKHYSNVLTLTFIQNNSTDVNEKRDLGKEIVIGERKMAFWRRQHNFNQDRATSEIIQIKQQWNTK